MNPAYKKLVDGLADVGEALIAIGQDPEQNQIKLLVSELVTKLNLNNADAVDTLTMLRFAVDNDDADLSKLTAFITGEPAQAAVEAPVEEEAPVAKAD